MGYYGGILPGTHTSLLSKTMNILILNWRDPFHPLAGGAEISLLEHAKYWQKNGADITWFASSFQGARKEEKKDGITYIRRGSHFTVHLLFIVYYLLNKGKLKEFNVYIDCFHFLPFFSPLFIKKKKIVALINEVAGKVWFSNLPYPLAWIGYHLEPWFFKAYKNTPFITASDSAKADLLKVGVPEKNIEIIPHGVIVENVSNSVKREKNPTFIFVGRVSKDKGIQDVLEGFRIIKHKTLNNKQPSPELWIVGKEEKEGFLEALLNDEYKDLNSDITYYGFVSQEKKFELLKRSWLLLHASVKEGWGLTVIEAGSQGTPTIGYNVEGLRDSIRHGKTGLLVDPNPHSLAEGALKVISDKAAHNSMRENAKKWSENFDWEKSGQKSWEYIKK